VLFLVAQLNTRFVCYVIWVSCFVYNLLRVVNWKIKVITIYQNFSLRLLHWLGNKMCKCLLVNKVQTRPCIRSTRILQVVTGFWGFRGAYECMFATIILTPCYRYQFKFSFIWSTYFSFYCTVWCIKKISFLVLHVYIMNFSSKESSSCWNCSCIGCTWFWPNLYVV